MLAILLAAAIALIGAAYEFRRIKNKEINFKLQEQRRETYKEFVAVLAPWYTHAVRATKGLPQPRLLTGELVPGVMHSKQMEVQIAFGLYASEESFRRFLAYNSAMLEWGELPKAQQTNESALEVQKTLGHLLVQMRKDVGFTDTGMTIREMLRFWMADLDKPEYDHLFADEKNYLSGRRAG